MGRDILTRGVELLSNLRLAYAGQFVESFTDIQNREPESAELNDGQVVFIFHGIACFLGNCMLSKKSRGFAIQPVGINEKIRHRAGNSFREAPPT